MNNTQQYITVVSGVPRSGTSMMMQMLDAGGMRTITDDIRKSDINNPYGYFEYEPVKQLSEKNEWLANAYGQAVKIIYLHLYQLPPVHQYKVIFMMRHLDEIVASQDAMLEGLNQKTGEAGSARFTNTIRLQLEKLDRWFESQLNIEILRVRYNDVVNRQTQSISEINKFLGYTLDEADMSKVIDPKLYRQKYLQPCGNVIDR